MSNEELKELMSIICEGQDSEQRRKVENFIEYQVQLIDSLDKEIERLNNIINELEKWLGESIEKHTEDYLDWKYDRKVYLAGSEKLQNVFDKLQELKGSDKE